MIFVTCYQCIIFFITPLIRYPPLIAATRLRALLPEPDFAFYFEFHFDVLSIASLVLHSKTTLSRNLVDSLPQGYVSSIKDCHVRFYPTQFDSSLITSYFFPSSGTRTKSWFSEACQQSLFALAGGNMGLLALQSMPDHSVHPANPLGSVPSAFGSK